MLSPRCVCQGSHLGHLRLSRLEGTPNIKGVGPGMLLKPPDQEWPWCQQRPGQTLACGRHGTQIGDKAGG